MGNFSLYTFEDLFNEDLSARTCYPLARYFQERLLGDGDVNDSECIGISIIYDHQLAHALWLARAIKRRWPDKLLVLGGTAVSGIYKHAKDKATLSRFFELSDAIVVGEGETAICEIAATSGDLSGARPITNTVTYDRRRAEVRLPDRIHYENVQSLGAPLYQHRWDLYLAPARGINYAPTRGCYWNRCTFCDYGLNTDKPTSPWRERRVEQVVADLTHVVTSQAIEYVYFAVDVMAPGYLERLADAIVAADLDIRWATELRMEKIFCADRCQRMARAGCVCVSFGMESGNQRVLDLIDKGTRVSCMADTMKNFGQTSVAVQLMAFKGFPTETADEYSETVKFIRTHKELWSAGGLGDFVLTGSAIIAKEPARFGLKLLETRNVDVARMINYVEEASERRSQLLLEEGDSSFEESRDVFPTTLGRPWAGGIDTLHSMIYYDERGKDVFKDHALPPRRRNESDRPPDLVDGIVQPLGRLTESCCDIAQIVTNEAAHRAHIKDVRAQFREPTFVELKKWQTEVPPVTNDAARRDAYLISEDKCKKLPPLLHKVIALAANGTMTIGEVLARLDPAAKTMVEQSLERLYESRLIDIITATRL
jgi:hypothetical protein